MNETPETIIQQLELKDKTLFEWVGKLEVKDTESQKNAENLLTDAKTAQKRATEAQKFLLDPIRESEKRVRDLFRPYLDRLALGISRINTLLGDYHLEQTKLAKAENEYLMAESAAKLEDAKETGEIVELPTVTIQAPAKTSRAELGTTSYLEGFDIIIINPSLVPHDLCEPSLSKIKARVKSGVKEIPGVLISNRTTIVSRVRKI